jgi:hypothetical protein
MKQSLLILGIIQCFVAIGAVPAGLSMIFHSDGSGLKMSMEILQGSPFNSFLIPGLFLFFIHGLLNIVGAVFSFRRHRIADKLGLLLGTLLLMWIIIQVYFTGIIHFLQPLFFVVAIFEIVVSWIINKKQKVK